jgi:hypothetical protein
MKENFREITHMLIASSFPVLRDKKIIVMTGFVRFYAFSVWIPPLLRLIVLSKHTRTLSTSAVTGLIAHELCHQERYLKMGVLKYFIFAVRFLFSRRTRSSEEKATDRLTIEKGYGRDLYELSVITHKDKNHDKIIDFYLSLDEIETYARNLNKWRDI